MKGSKIIIMAAAALMVSCNEVIDVSVRDSQETYFIVDGLLTNMAGDPQEIILSRSLPYFSKDGVPEVSGADVTVSDGSTTTIFKELEDKKGTYRAPEGFACKKGRTYKLSVKAVIDGKERSYQAESEMPEPACTTDSIICVYTPVMKDVTDSCWTVLVWGKDNYEDAYYLMIPSVNGHTYPFENHIVFPDTYFARKKIQGFPTSILMQTKENYDKYGECAKYLETGDVITLDIHNVTRDYYNFVTALGNSRQSIPLFSPQPSNTPTNIIGENALGYFTCSNVVRTSYTITDPFIEKHDVLK